MFTISFIEILSHIYISDEITSVTRIFRNVHVQPNNLSTFLRINNDKCMNFKTYQGLNKTNIA